MSSVEEKESDINIELVEAKPKKKGGKRPGAGRPSLVRENKKRMEMGLEPILPKQRINRKVTKSKSNAILPESKKARHQEILAEMLGRKSQFIVQKVLDKALDDNDEDQMACLKLVMDRVLPADYLAKNKGKSSGITIQIMGVESNITTVENDDEIIEADFESIDETD